MPEHAIARYFSQHARETAARLMYHQGHMTTTHGTFPRAIFPLADQADPTSHDWFLHDGKLRSEAYPRWCPVGVMLHVDGAPQAGRTPMLSHVLAAWEAAPGTLHPLDVPTETVAYDLRNFIVAWDHGEITDLADALGGAPR